MKFIFGTKIGMTAMADKNGRMMPVTVFDVQPNTVVQLKTQEKDGYESVQVGFGTKKKVSKPQKGHMGDLGIFRFLREVRGKFDLNRGDKVDVSSFEVGDIVKVSANSKGKGFQGAVKRHGFSGMPSGHGHYSVKRHIGSIGQRFPQHTLKGKRMAGRMGNVLVSMRGLKVVSVDKEDGMLAVKGSVPGNRGQMVQILSK